MVVHSIRSYIILPAAAVVVVIVVVIAVVSVGVTVEVVVPVVGDCRSGPDQKPWLLSE